jgi:hypothetical protein
MAWLRTFLLGVLISIGWIVGVWIHGDYFQAMLPCLLIGVAIAALPFNSTWNKSLSLFFTFLYGSLGVLYYGAFRLGAEGFDRSFFWHLDIGVLEAASGSLALIACSTVALAAILYTPILLKNRAALPLYVFPPVVAVCLWFHPLHATYDLLATLNNKGEKTLAEELMLSRRVTPSTAIAPSEFSPPRNLIFIYLETMERAWLESSAFGTAGANLKNIEKSATVFTDILQYPGTTWTAAGMFASQCGLPLNFGFQVDINVSRRMFPMKSVSDSTPCIGDVLKSAGYNTAFLSATFEKFAGKQDIMSRHGIDKFIGYTQVRRMVPKKTPTFTWGYHDETMYTLARKELKRLSGRNKPFALILEATDMHGPGGFPSPHCREKSPEGEDTMLRALRCTTLELADFLDDVRSDPALANTVVVLQGDHLAFSNNIHADTLKSFDRKIVFNLIANHLPPRQIHHRGTHFDIAPTILEALGFKQFGEFPFGRSLLSHKSGFVHAQGLTRTEIGSVRLELLQPNQVPHLPSRVMVDKKRTKVSFGDIAFEIGNYPGGDCAICSWVFSFNRDGRFAGLHRTRSGNVERPKGTPMVLVGPSLVSMPNIAPDLAPIPFPYMAIGMMGESGWRLFDLRKGISLPAEEVANIIGIAIAGESKNATAL